MNNCDNQYVFTYFSKVEIYHLSYIHLLVSTSQVGKTLKYFVPIWVLSPPTRHSLYCLPLFWHWSQCQRVPACREALKVDFHIIAGVFQLGFEHCEKHRVRIQTLFIQ